MKCDRIREDLGAYLDDELDSARRSELDGHLASCEACAAELHRLRKLSKLVADVPRATAPAGLAARIVSSAREPRPRVLRLSRWTGGLAAVAAVLLVGVVTIVMLRERDARDTVGSVAETSDEESAGTLAAGEDAGAALDRKRLDGRAETERRVLARKVRGPEKRSGDMLKKEAASKVASGPPPARIHRKGAPPPAKKAVAARTPAPSKPARPWRKGKADAAPSTPREPVVGKRVGFRATRGKAGPGGRGVAQQAVPAGPGEQVQVEVQAPQPKAEESDRSRGRLVDLLRDKKLQEGREGKKEKDRAAEALFAKMRKAKAPAREADVAGGEPVIRLQLRADSPAKELARIIAAAERLGGSVSRRAETKAVREQAIRPPARGRGAADETVARRPGVIRVRIPRGRTGEFLASLERLTLPEADEAPADARARTQRRSGGTPAAAAAGQSGAAVSQARRPVPSQTRPSEGQDARLAQRPAGWVVIEIVIHAPPDRPVEAKAARQRR